MKPRPQRQQARGRVKKGTCDWGLSHASIGVREIDGLRRVLRTMSYKKSIGEIVEEPRGPDILQIEIWRDLQKKEKRNSRSTLFLEI